MAGRLYQNQDFMRLWAAKIGSAFGSRITRTVLPIIAISMLGATPTEVGVLSAAQVASGVFAAVLVGGLVDRRAKKGLLVTADLLRATMILTIPLAALLGMIEMWLLYLVTAVVGAASALFQIADNSYLPVLVRKKDLVAANSKFEATDSVAESTGPGLAGILVDILSAPVAMLIDAATYVWSAVMIARIRSTEAVEPDNAVSSVLLGEAITGLGVCWKIPAVRSLLVVEAIMGLFGGGFYALYMILGLTWLNLSPTVLGLVISVGGLGAFAGAALAEHAVKRFGEMPVLVSSLLFGQLSALFVPMALINTEFGIWFLIGGQLFGDGFLTVFLIVALSLRQRVVAQRALGRVNATFHMAGQGFLAIGALLAGPLVGAIGFQSTLWLISCGGLLAVPIYFVVGRGVR